MKDHVLQPIRAKLAVVHRTDTPMPNGTGLPNLEVANNILATALDMHYVSSNVGVGKYACTELFRARIPGELDEAELLAVYNWMLDLEERLPSASYWLLFQDEKDLIWFVAVSLGSVFKTPGGEIALHFRPQMATSLPPSQIELQSLLDGTLQELQWNAFTISST